MRIPPYYLYFYTHYLLPPPPVFRRPPPGGAAFSCLCNNTEAYKASWRCPSRFDTPLAYRPQSKRYVRSIRPKPLHPSVYGPHVPLENGDLLKLLFMRRSQLSLFLTRAGGTLAHDSRVKRAEEETCSYAIIRGPG
jgi:hypothetical protein